jgi:PAS domain S-box-containing protein
MGLSVSLLLILAGVCTHAGLYHLMAWHKLRREWVHAAFGAACLLASGYTVASAVQYGTTSVDTYILATRWQAAAAIAFTACLYWVVAGYTGVAPRVLLVAATLLCAALEIWNACSPYSLWYSAIGDLRREPMAWGETVTLVTATPGPVFLSDTLAQLVLAGLATHALVRQYRRGQRAEALSLALALGVLLTTVLVDVLHDVFAWDTAYVAEYGVVALILLMADSLTAALRDRTLALEEAHAELLSDATRLRRAHRALEESEARFRTALDSVADPILLYGVDGRIVQANRSAADAFGYTDKQLRSLTVRDLTACPGDAREPDPVEIAEPITVMRRCRRSDGTCFHAEVRMRGIRFGGEHLTIALARDVSERERLQEELRQAHKMEAVGRLAGGIAHEFNNILQVVLASGEIAIAEAPRGSSAHAALQVMLQSSLRAARLVRQLLAFGRQQALSLADVDPGRLVSATAASLRQLVGEQITVRVRCAPGPGSVRADRAQLQQVLRDLCASARDAMPEGGEITLEMEYVDLTPDSRATRPGMRAGRYAVIRVRDTGRGLDEEACSRIFDPFYTIGEMGVAGGLGLAAAHGIIEQHGGSIIVDSKAGEGTRFEIYLPTGTGQAA